MKNLDTKQKVMLVLTVILFVIIGWQVIDMAGFGEKSGTSSQPVGVNVPASQTVAAPASATSPQVQSVADLRLDNDNLTDNQREYLELASEYQLAKMRRLLAQERSALRLATNGNSQYSWDGGFDTDYGSGYTVSRGRQVYKLNYVGYQHDRWMAIVSYNNALFTVTEGSELPDNTRVIDINADGVVLQRGADKQYVKFETTSPFIVNDSVKVTSDERLLEELLQELTEEEFVLPENSGRAIINEAVEPKAKAKPAPELFDNFMMESAPVDMAEELDPDWLELIFQDLSDAVTREDAANAKTQKKAAPPVTAMPRKIDVIDDSLDVDTIDMDAMLSGNDAIDIEPAIPSADASDLEQVSEDDWFSIDATAPKAMPQQEDALTIPNEAVAEAEVSSNWDDNSAWDNNTSNNNEVAILPVEPRIIDEPASDDDWLNEWLDQGFGESDYYSVDSAQVGSSSTSNSQNTANEDAWYVWDGEQWVEERS